METTNLFIHTNQFQDLVETLKNSTTFVDVKSLSKDKVNFLSALVGIADECCSPEIETISVFGKTSGKEIRKESNIEETNFFHGNLVPDIQGEEESASGNIGKGHIAKSNLDNGTFTNKFISGDDSAKVNIDKQDSKTTAELFLPAAEKEKNNSSMQQTVKPGWLKENMAGDIEPDKETKTKRTGNPTANQATDKIVENIKVDASLEKGNRILGKEDLLIKLFAEKEKNNSSIQRKVQPGWLKENMAGDIEQDKGTKTKRAGDSTVNQATDKNVENIKAVMPEEQSSDKGRYEEKKNLNYNQEIEKKNLADLNKNRASILNKRLNNFFQQDSMPRETNDILNVKYPAIKSKDSGNRINSFSKSFLKPDGELKIIKNTEEININSEKDAVISKQKPGIVKELFHDSKGLDTIKLDGEDKKQEAALLPSRNIGKTSDQVLSDNTDGKIKQTDRDGILSQIVNKAVVNFKNGRTEMKISLKPESLGHIKLGVSTDNHHVIIKIMAESPYVKEIIENNLNQLKNVLSSHGMEIDKLDVLVADNSDQYGRKNNSNEFIKMHRKDQIDDDVSDTAVREDEESIAVTRGDDEKLICVFV